MERYLIPIGLILNSLLMIVNRWKRLPDWLYLPGLLLGIGLIIAGAFLTRA